MVPTTVDNTWGAAFVGTIVASILYGITTLQVYYYYLNYPDDPRRLKVLAACVWLLDSLSLALVCVGMYGYLVSDMIKPLDRFWVNRAFDVDPAIMGLMAFLTHVYLGHRVWRVCNRNVWLGFTLAILSLSALSLAIASSAISFRFELWSEKRNLKPLALAGTIIVVVLDGMIATVLCVFLSRQVEACKGLARLVRRVAIFAINTGLATSIMATMNVITFLVFPETMIFLGTNLIFTKVYANCLLANLNARDSLRRGLDEEPLELNFSAFRTTFRTTTTTLSVGCPESVCPTSDPDMTTARRSSFDLDIEGKAALQVRTTATV